MRTGGLRARPALLLLFVGALLAATTGPSGAQGGPRQVAELKFAEQRPSTPTAANFDIDYVNPEDPNEKPHSVRRIVSEFAPGTVIDTSVPERCTASDAQLIASGATACPPASQVGVGYVRIDTGLSAPERFIEEDLALFNTEGQLIFLFTDRSTGLRLVSRCPIEGARITCTSPPLPGAPPDGGAVDVVHEELFELSRTVDGTSRGYITTPPECPTGGAWTNIAEFTYADGATQTVETLSPCEASGDRGESRGRCRGRRATHRGTAGTDTIAGTPGRDVIVGRGGDDTINAGDGDDLICGRRGADRLAGGAGDDALRAGRGNDRLRGGPGLDDLRGWKGRDACEGGNERSCER